MDDRIETLAGESWRLHEQGLYAEALEASLTALALSQQDSEDYLNHAICLGNVGSSYRALDDYARAASFQLQARELLQEKMAEAKNEYATCTNNLASVWRAMGRYIEAKKLQEEVLAIRRDLAVDPDQDPAVAESMDNLGTVLHDLGDHTAALGLHRDALDMRTKALGRSHPTVAQSLNNLGCLYFDMGNYSDAASCFERALSIREMRLGPRHIDLTESLVNLAVLHFSIHELNRAEALFRSALEIQVAALSPTSPRVANTLGNIATVLRVRGGGRKLDEGSVREIMALEERAMSIHKESFGEKHPAIAVSLRGIAYTLVQLGNSREAERLFTKSMRINQDALGFLHREAARDLMGRASVRLSLGKWKGAGRDLLQAMEILVSTLGDSHPDLSVVVAELAQLYAATERDSEAFSCYQQSIAIDTEAIGQVF